MVDLCVGVWRVYLCGIVCLCIFCVWCGCGMCIVCDVCFVYVTCVLCVSLCVVVYLCACFICA